MSFRKPAVGSAQGFGRKNSREITLTYKPWALIGAKLDRALGDSPGGNGLAAAAFAGRMRSLTSREWKSRLPGRYTTASYRSRVEARVEKPPSRGQGMGNISCGAVVRDRTCLEKEVSLWELPDHGPRAAGAGLPILELPVGVTTASFRAVFVPGGQLKGS